LFAFVIAKYYSLFVGYFMSAVGRGGSIWGIGAIAPAPQGSQKKYF